MTGKGEKEMNRKRKRDREKEENFCMGGYFKLQTGYLGLKHIILYWDFDLFCFFFGTFIFPDHFYHS